MFLAKRFFLTFVLVFILSTSFTHTTSAASLFGYNDPPGCGGDSFLPNLIICGRSPAAAGPACSQFTKACNVGDLVETGSRVLVWLISFALLVVPLLVMYYGAMIMWNQNMDGDTGVVKWAKTRLKEIIFYFILMLAAWLIVKTVIDIFQVDDSNGRVPIFLLDEGGNSIKVKSFNTQ